jgi:proteasome accessory factor C
MRVLHMGGHWYLEGWCHRTSAVRMFRLDRIVDVSVLDADGTPPATAQSRDLDAGLFAPGPDDAVVTLRVEPYARWVVDYYPIESVQTQGDGSLLLRMRTGDTAWLRQLVLRPRRRGPGGRPARACGVRRRLGPRRSGCLR